MKNNGIPTLTAFLFKASRRCLNDGELVDAITRKYDDLISSKNDLISSKEEVLERAPAKRAKVLKVEIQKLKKRKEELEHTRTYIEDPSVEHSLLDMREIGGVIIDVEKYNPSEPYEKLLIDMAEIATTSPNTKGWKKIVKSNWKAASIPTEIHNPNYP